MQDRTTPESQFSQQRQVEGSAPEGGIAMSPPAFQLQASAGPVQRQEAQMSQLDHARHLINLFENDSQSPSAWSAVSKGAFINALRGRIGSPFGMSQHQLQACGPAAFGFAWAETNIYDFTAFMITLYKYGRANLGNRVIDPKDGLLSRAPGDSEWNSNHTVNNIVDWMFMASLRSDKTLPGRDFEDTDDQFDGISLPHDMYDWLAGTGSYDPIINDARVAVSQGFNHFKNTMDQKHLNRYKCFLLIDARLINSDRRTLLGMDAATSGEQTASAGPEEGSQQVAQAKAAKGGPLQAKADAPMQRAAIQESFGNLSWFPNHWVVYRGNLREDGDMASFTVWSWGQGYQVTVPKRLLGGMYYGAVMARPTGN